MKPLKGEEFTEFLRTAAYTADRFPLWMTGGRNVSYGYPGRGPLPKKMEGDHMPGLENEDNLLGASVEEFNCFKCDRKPNYISKDAFLSLYKAMYPKTGDIIKFGSRTVNILFASENAFTVTYTESVGQQHTNSTSRATFFTWPDVLLSMLAQEYDLC